MRFVLDKIDYSRTAVSLLAGIALMAAMGCGDKRPSVPVSGQVTYGGGEWPRAGHITFKPLSSGEGGAKRPGSARFGTDGKFVVGSFAPGDGLMPGTYLVSISSFNPNESSGKSLEELNLVPADFKMEDLVVEAGMDPIELSFDVPKK